MPKIASFQNTDGSSMTEAEAQICDSILGLVTGLLLKGADPHFLASALNGAASGITDIAARAREGDAGGKTRH